MTTKVTIVPFSRKHVPEVERLRDEFEAYLDELSSMPRKKEPKRARVARLLKDCFGKNHAFDGLIALENGNVVGYIFYQQMYDPDEMKGRVMHVIDLFVTNNVRKSGVGGKLMRAIARKCMKIGGKAMYFAVWRKNKTAINFYRKLGADWIKDVPFMRWDFSGY